MFDQGTIERHIRKGIGWCIVIIALSLTLSPTSAQTEVTVQQPVDGLYARTSDIGQPPKQLGIVDISAASWTTLPYSSLTRPLWSPDGQYIAYASASSAILEVASGTIIFTAEEVIGALTPFDLNAPRGWSADGLSLAITFAQVGSLSSLVKLYDVDLITHTAQEIRQWRTDEQVTDMPLPPNATSVQLTGGSSVDRNPVFDDWFLIQFDGSGFYSTFDIGEPVNADINVLWNSRTNEYISLDALVLGLSLSILSSDWSHDGTRLLLQARSKDLREPYLMTFHFTPDVGVTLMEEAVVDDRIPQHWLDAGDLFFSRIQVYETGAAYVLGEIVDGEYREVPFFTLNGNQFRYDSFGDWFMQADEDERHRLSCLFEWSLPARLMVGENAEILAGESGLILHSDPDRFSTQISTLSQGTIVTVVGGDACSGGYRWWQVQLGDGSTGWITEADSTEYFMQSFTPPTSTPTFTFTPTDTPTYTPTEMVYPR